MVSHACLSDTKGILTISASMTNQPPTSFLYAVDGTVVSCIYGHFSGKGSSMEMRLLLIVGLVIFVHEAVKIIRNSSEWLIGNARNAGGARKRPG
jgi:hypothetical protein